MQKRQRHEIVRDILLVCNGGAIISKIMFHSYMTHGMAKAYLSELIASGLIETDLFESRKYVTTAKGLEYLSALESMHEMLSLDLVKTKAIV